MATRRIRTSTTRVEVSSDRGVFMISVAAELAQMHPQTLRMYEARGLIEPQRSPKGTRLYSQEDVERLRRIQQMTADLGLNLAGVERVLELESRIEEMRERVQELEEITLQAEARLAQGLEEGRRSFRAALVPHPASPPPGRARSGARPTRARRSVPGAPEGADPTKGKPCRPTPPTQPP